MKLTDVQNDQQLWECMTEPTDALMEFSARMPEPVVVLGGSGKMGRELTGMLRRADEAAGIQRKITVASTFSNPDDKTQLESQGIETMQGDLGDEAFLDTLPDLSLVIYMLGFKFGSSQDFRRTFHLNAVTPYLVGRKYSNARIVMFSSGNFYPRLLPDHGGCREASEITPNGVYGWSLVARESAFSTTALQSPNQQVCMYRLMYAQHLCYGVLVDLAKMIQNDEPISLAIPAVNLVSQRDANDVALRSLEYTANPPSILNIGGSVVSVRDVCEQLGLLLGHTPTFIEPEGETALLANDELSQEMYGPYRDSVEDLIQSVARWVQRDGTYWNKPTKFGVVNHAY